MAATGLAFPMTDMDKATLPTGILLPFEGFHLHAGAYCQQADPVRQAEVVLFSLFGVRNGVADALLRIPRY